MNILGIWESFDFIATRDDVTHGKPDPEFYELVARELNTDPGECLVFEDSLAGAKSALKAENCVIAIPTPFTRKCLFESHISNDRLVISESEDLKNTAIKKIKENWRMQ